MKDIFLDSDTDMMVLSFVPSTREAEPLTIAAADAVRRIVDRMDGTHRPADPRPRESQPGRRRRGDGRAEAALERLGLEDLYPVGPDGKGFFLSDDAGVRFIERARALGVKVICVHKGIPFRQSYEHSQCRDIGVVAKRFPDVSFLVYHSASCRATPSRATITARNATAWTR